MEMEPKEFTIDGVPVRIEASRNADFSVTWHTSIDNHLAVTLHCFYANNANNFSLCLREGYPSPRARRYSDSNEAVDALVATVLHYVETYKASTESAQMVDTLLDELAKKYA